MKLVIFGCGKISNRIAKSCKLVEGLKLVGFASKDILKAKQYAEAYNCEKYGTYDDFLNSDVEAVYIATYNNSHYDLIKKCVKHKKNVICEKPMLFDSKQIKEIFELARKNNVLVMEALKSVFLPIIIKCKEMIRNKEIGEIKRIYASFMRNGSHNKDHWINQKGTGGALKDLGSYTIGTMNYLMDVNPVVINMETDETDNSSDTSAYVDLKYGDIIGRSNVSNSIDGDNFLLIEGEKGYIKVNDFWKTGIGEYEVDNQKYELNMECISDFYYELKHFKDLVDNNIYSSPIMSEKASLAIINITNKEYV